MQLRRCTKDGAAEPQSTSIGQLNAAAEQGAAEQGEGKIQSQFHRVEICTWGAGAPSSPWSRCLSGSVKATAPQPTIFREAWQMRRCAV